MKVVLRKCRNGAQRLERELFVQVRVDVLEHLLESPVIGAGRAGVQRSISWPSQASQLARRVPDRSCSSMPEASFLYAIAWFRASAQSPPARCLRSATRSEPYRAGT